MQIQLESQPSASIEADALVTYVFDRDDKFDGVLADINVGMNGRLSALSTSGELTGKSLETVLIHFPQGLASQRLLLIGAGKTGEVQRQRFAQDCWNGASLSEIARREENRVSGARG